MRFQLTIDSTDAAFVDDPRGELVRAIYRVADMLCNDADQPVRPVYDSNGNRCGTVTVEGLE